MEPEFFQGSVRSGKMVKLMSFSTKRWAYCPRPSFLGQFEISCIAATDGLVVVQPNFAPRP